MSSSRVLLSFFGLMAYRGLVLSPIAAIAGFLLLFLYGIFYGVIVSVLIGGICGLIAGTVTVLFYRDVHNERAYLRTMILTTAISAFLLGFLIFGATHSFYAVVEVPVPNGFGLLGGVLAACGAIYAGREGGRWYIQSQKATSHPLPQL